MAGTTPMTQDTGLLHASMLLDALLDLPAATSEQERAARRTLTFHVLHVVKSLIRRELTHIDFLYRSRVREGIYGAACVLATQRGWQSGYEPGEGSYATRDDVIHLLSESMPPAAFLVELCRQLEVEPPDVVQAALATPAT